MLNNEVHLYNQKQNDHIQDNDYNELHQDILLENDYSYIIFSNKIPRFTTTITNQTTWTFTLLMTNLMTIMTRWLNKGEIYYNKLYDLYIRRFKKWNYQSCLDSHLLEAYHLHSYNLTIFTIEYYLFLQYFAIWPGFPQLWQ